MPRSATLLRIDPEVVRDVLNLFNSVGREIPYRDDRLSIYIKGFEDMGQYYLGHVLIDVEDEVKVRRRVDGDIKIEPQKYIRCEEVKFAYFPRITGSAEIPHVTVVLSRDSITRLLATVVEKIVGRNAFLRVRFLFTSSNEVNIRNNFDDIVRIRGEDVLDAVITGISIKGSRLYQAPLEYQKALSGEVKQIGVALNDDWFIVTSSGKIITYRRLSDEEFIDRIHQIVTRLLRSGAVVL